MGMISRTQTAVLAKAAHCFHSEGMAGRPNTSQNSVRTEAMEEVWVQKLQPQKIQPSRMYF
jgi:hypothetical protein